MMTLVYYAIFGLLAGLIARFLVPGKDPMGLLGTMVLGVVGSFAGGFVWNLIFGGGGNLLDFRMSSFIGSVGGAVLLLLLMRFIRSRS